MSEYIPKYPSQEGDDSNKSSSELLAETLKPIYVPQDLMLAWESHLASYSRDTHVLLDQVKDSELTLNTQYQALLTRVQKYEQMLQDITMDSNEFTIDDDEVNFTGWNILAQASYWDYLLRKEITKLSDQIKSAEYKGGLVTEVTDAVLEGLIADNTYISNVIGALSDTPLIRELDEALTSTTTSLSELQAEYVRLAEKQAADAEALAHQQVENAEQLVESINTAVAVQLDRIAQEAAIRTQLLQELEDRTNALAAQAEADVGVLTAQVDSIREGAAADKASILETVSGYRTELKSDIATVNSSLLGALDGVHTLVTEVRDKNGVTLNELTTYKASNDVAIAGLVSKVSTNVSDTAANASKITGLTAELATTNTELGKVRNTTASALSKADTAVTANSALATRVDSLAAAITDLGEGAETAVDVYAFNALKAEVGTNTAGVSSLVEQVNALGTNYTNLADGVKANTDAVSTLTVKQSEMNGDISQLSSDVTYLTSELGVTNTALNTKASNQALSNLNTKLTTTDGKVAANTQQLTQLNSDLTTVKNGLETKASTEALNNLATDVTELEGGLAVNASAITNLKSEIDTELNKKATVTAVNGLTTKVNEVEGKTTTNANSILALNTSVGNVVNGLANKLDASAISDYYTKSQTDAKASEVAAGKVEEFNASLKVGGENLWSLDAATPTKEQGNANIEYIDRSKEHYKVTVKSFGSSNVNLTRHDDMLLSKSLEDVDKNSQYTLSFEIRASKPGISIIYSYFNSANTITHIGVNTEWQRFEFTPSNKPLGTSATSTGHLFAFGLNTSNGWAVDDWYEVRHIQMQKGTKATAFSKAPLALQNALDANSSAIQTTNTEVSRVDGRVTATNSAQTLLEGRVQTVEGGISKKADASALSSLDTRVGSVEGKYTSQASDITRLNNSLDTTNVNVGTAQTAAQNAMNAAGAKGKVIFGTTAPAVADRLVQNLWIDTTSNANTPKRWNGSAWVVVTDKVATDAANAVSALDIVVKTKADVSALNSLTTKVTDEAGKTTANTNSITTLNSDIVSINNNLATKANASALNDIYTKQQTDAKATEVAAGEISKYDASLVIGGRNLVLNSAAEISASSGTVWVRGMPMERNNYYAFSVDLKGTGSIRFVVSTYSRPVSSVDINGAVGSDAGGAIEIALTEEYKRYWVVILCGNWSAERDTKNVNLILNTGSAASVKNIKFEKGNKATDWSPSPEDTQASLDANATAIENTNAEVKRVDGRVTTNSTHITTLQGKVTTVENGLATKADGSALSALTTRVSNAEGGLSSQSSKVTKLEAGVGNTSTYVISTSRNGGFRAGGLPWGLYNSTLTRLAAFSRGFNLVVWANDGSYSSVQMFDTYGSSANVASLATALLALPVNTYFTLVGTDNLGTSAALQGNAELKNFVIANGGSASYYSTWGGNNLPIFTSMVGTGTGTGIQHSFNSDITNDWIKYPISLISGIPEGFAGVQPIDESKFATASALSTLDSKVTSIDGKVTTNSTSITNLSGKITAVENGLATKADGSALSSLATRVSNAEGGISTQSTALTKLSASLQSQGANLQQDGGFETLTATSGAMSAFTADKYSGSQCLKFARVAPTGSGGNNDVYWGDFFDVAGGRTYYVEAYVRRDPNETVTPNANTYFTLGINVLLKLTGAHGWLAAKYVKLAELSNTWSKVSGYITVPNNYDKGRLWLAFPQSVNNAQNSSVLIDAVFITDATEGFNAQSTADATSSAITATNSEVSRVNGVVSGHTTQLSNLTASIAGKADTAALNALTVRVEAEEGKSSSQASSITNLTASLSDTDTIAKNALPQVTGASGIKSFKDVLSYYISTSNNANNIVIETPITFGAYMFKIMINGYNYVLNKSVIECSVSGYAYPGPTYHSYSATDLGTSSARMRLGIKNGKVCVILSPKGTNWSYPQFSVSASIGHTTPPDSWKDGWSAIMKTEAELATYGITSIIEPSTLDVSGEIQATASAVSTLDTKVENIDGKVTTQASQILTLTSDNTANKNALQVQAKVVDGVKANYMVKMETNGVIGGFGLMQSTGVLGQVSTSFGVNADSFFIGAPVGGKKPFMVTTANQVVDGITYPAGTWINSAIIANATIGTAKIADLAVTGAKIANATIDNGKIINLDASKINAGYINAARIQAGSITADKLQINSLSTISADLGTIKVGSANIEDLSVSTIKIQDNAITVPVGVSALDKKSVGVFIPGIHNLNQQITAWEGHVGSLASITINRSGGKCRLDAHVSITQQSDTGLFASWGNNTISIEERFLIRAFISVYRGSVLVGRSSIPPSTALGAVGIRYGGSISLVAALDESVTTGNETYTLKFGFGYVGTAGGSTYAGTAGKVNFILSDIRLSIMEMKK